MDAHPGWEIVIDDEELLDLDKGEEEVKAEVKASDADQTTPVIKTVDDEYKTDDGEKNYYSIAHTIHEKVTAQASILVNGKLKGSLTNFLCSCTKQLCIRFTMCCLFSLYFSAASINIFLNCLI